MIEEDTRGYGRSVGGVPEALARVDADGDGCVSIPELLRVPVIRIAILLQNPALIFEEAPANTEGKSKRTAWRCKESLLSVTAFTMPLVIPRCITLLL